MTTTTTEPEWWWWPATLKRGRIVLRSTQRMSAAHAYPPGAWEDREAARSACGLALPAIARRAPGSVPATLRCVPCRRELGELDPN